MTIQTFSSLVADPRPAPVTAFDRVLHQFLDDVFHAYPTWATGVGYHLVDDRWPDSSEAGRQARVAMLDRSRDAFLALADADVSDDERVDRDIAVELIDKLRFDEDVLREGNWDPLQYVYLLGSGFFSLLAREYGPWAHRGAAFLRRVEGLPALVDAAAGELTGAPDRPVSLLHTETALAQLSGVAELIDEGIAEARRQAEQGEEPGLVAALDEAAGPAKAALDGFRARLESEVRARASGWGRMGPDLYQQRLRHALSSDIGFEELRTRAWADYNAVRGEMLRIATDLWPQWVPGEPLPETGQGDEDRESVIVRRVLDAIALEHRRADELLDWCQAEVSRIEAFCREHDVIGLPDEPLRITWTPVFMRAYGRAFLDSPGPLDKGQSSYFWITPPDENARPEDVESYLREDNDRMLKLLCIHEGVPGHYLQLAWSNRTPSLTRSVFGNGMFAEGWAVYVTQVMMDLGYGDAEGALLLNHWKFYLRAITNAIMDVEIHAGEMDEQAAMDLMVKGGFQEPDEARAKWLRARLTATQLPTYYMGSLEMWDMEVAARQRAAMAAGAGPESVPAQRVVGGLGETPGFDYRKHLEAVISHGSPPIKWVARSSRKLAEPQNE